MQSDCYTRVITDHTRRLRPGHVVLVDMLGCDEVCEL
jgi:hypothetical protein